MPVKVSIVLPIYNYAHYLEARMRSLLDQTWQNFELIAVDDGSTDDSRSVVDRFRHDARIRTLWFDTNAGKPYQRWNDGAAIATGEYILFAGADDLCEPTLVETLVRLLDADEEVGIAHVRCRVIDARGNPGRLKPSGDRWNDAFVATGAEEAPFLLLANTIPNASAALFRRSVFERCGRFDTSLRLCADYMLYARMLTVSRLAYSPEPLNYFRAHGRTLRSTEGPRRLVPELYEVFAFIVDAFDIPHPEREAAWNRLAGRWLDRPAGRGPWTAVRERWETYRHARRFDPAVHWRAVRSAGRRLRQYVRPGLRSGSAQRS